MASRSPPAGHPGTGTRSPARQSVSLRWINNAAPAAAASRAAQFPAKKWPPVGTTAPSPVIAASTTAVEKEKKSPVSAFQSARAVFEAKKVAAATATPPTLPPTRRRLSFPVPAPPVVEKQYSASSDLSASSCSTVDSENDRKLEESAEARNEPKPSSPVHVVVKTVEKESVVATPPKRDIAKISPHATGSAPRSPTHVTQAFNSSGAAVMVLTREQVNQLKPDHVDIDPFRLLLPVEAVPILPDEVPCMYDTAAIEMQKNIKRVVRKLLKKNKVRLEEFKVNSRLFGTEFMDSHAYLDTLITDFGATRALQLVPCLLSIQPDILKSSALLLTAKNYVLRNEEALEREFQALQNLEGRRNLDAGVGSATASVAVKASSLATAAAVVTLSPPVIATPTPTSEVRKEVSSTNVDATQNTIDGNDPAFVGTAVSKDSCPAVQMVDPEESSAPAAGLVRKERAPAEVIATTKKEAAKAVEPMPEPQVVGQTVLPPPLIDIAVVAPIQISATATPRKEIMSTPVAKERAKSGTPSDSEDEYRAENLFGETINPVPQKQHEQQQQQQRQSNTGVCFVAPISPVSSTNSFDEAESLFGERLSSSSRSSTGRRKTVTWGETQTVEAPAEPARPVKMAKKPAPLIFGLATAAAFDSDSDESDFSD